MKSPFHSNKDPRDMSVEELRLLLQIKKLELKMEGIDVLDKLSLGRRVAIFIQKSGVFNRIFSHKENVEVE
jgi:hypothetical protein